MTEENVIKANKDYEYTYLVRKKGRAPCLSDSFDVFIGYYTAKSPEEAIEKAIASGVPLFHRHVFYTVFVDGFEFVSSDVASDTLRTFFKNGLPEESNMGKYKVGDPAWIVDKCKSADELRALLNYDWLQAEVWEEEGIITLRRRDDNGKSHYLSVEPLNYW